MSQDQVSIMLSGVCFGFVVGICCCLIMAWAGAEAAQTAFGAGWLSCIVMAARKARLLP